MRYKILDIHTIIIKKFPIFLKTIRLWNILYLISCILYLIFPCQAQLVWRSISLRSLPMIRFSSREM